MLSKCANPGCDETFRYLHQGKIFRLYPNPILRASAPGIESVIAERFWLCSQCCETMTVVWAGSRIKVVPIPKKVERALILFPTPQQNLLPARAASPKQHRAAAAGED